MILVLIMHIFQIDAPVVDGCGDETRLLCVKSFLINLLPHPVGSTRGLDFVSPTGVTPQPRPLRRVFHCHA